MDSNYTKEKTHTRERRAERTKIKGKIRYEYFSYAFITCVCLFIYVSIDYLKVNRLNKSTNQIQNRPTNLIKFKIVPQI